MLVLQALIHVPSFCSQEIGDKEIMINMTQRQEGHHLEELITINQ
jgi:hypothetical protein